MEYTAEEIKLATDNFSRRLRFGSQGVWSCVYIGRLKHDKVAIKFLIGNQEDHFKHMVKSLSKLRHPNLLRMKGFCSELKCFVYKYMEKCSLQDVLLSSNENSKNKTIPWHDRIRIATEVCSVVCYLHEASCVLGQRHLCPSNILIDRNLVAKVDFVEQKYDGKCNFEGDVKAFGKVILSLLTATGGDLCLSDLFAVLDKRAGRWPMDLAPEKLLKLSETCNSFKPSDYKDSSYMLKVREELNEIRENADDIIRQRSRTYETFCGGAYVEDSNIPNAFVCPIFKEVMKDPHVAADGFSYERKAIAKWLKLGSYRSPMTNLVLEHKVLRPNHTLLFLIQDWQSANSSP